jgi:(E)-4-hydroxy-3-methylbut-2-enyl-diphosphate synthase
MEYNEKELNYCQSITDYTRINTRVVDIGNTPVGGNFPIRIQSMTNTQTSDVAGTVEQSIELINAGCEYVRITVPTVKDTIYLKAIKKQIREHGYHTPLIADIHFNQKVAELSAEIVEKVRINPGNFADKNKSFQKIDYTENEYQNELNKLKIHLAPFIEICKKNKTAIRIGTNHGSLSDRIMSKYGDTPAGMVEATLEFLRICRELDFHEIVISLKASNTLVMVQATRLLVHSMMKEEMNYPLHLGVTEAGDGEDGRIKSAVGIGALLADGIGDTIRISLTENPVNEIFVAKQLLNYLKERIHHKPLKPVKLGLNPYQFNRRKTKQCGNIGGNKIPVVISDLRNELVLTYEILEEIGFSYEKNTNQFIKNDIAPDYIIANSIPENISLPEGLGVIANSIQDKVNKKFIPLLNVEQYKNDNDRNSYTKLLQLTRNELDNELLTLLNNDSKLIILLETDHKNGYAEQRACFFDLIHAECQAPVIIHRSYNEAEIESFQLKAAMDVGPLFLDGLGDGICLSNQGNFENKIVITTALGILQASRARIYKTEYISCPGCGRTLFNLQETTTKIKEKTSHLKSLKIGIMGCIVNGIGEMADADYGYVGSGTGKISLYKAKELVKRNIPEINAVDELINLIKMNGDWKEK